jgi:hypothetical protein
MERGNLVDDYSTRKAYPHQRKRTGDKERMRAGINGGRW